MQAALEGNVVNLAELLHTGALVNVKEANGLTALSIAISFGRTDAVIFLLEHGADVSSSDASG